MLLLKGSSGVARREESCAHDLHPSENSFIVYEIVPIELGLIIRCVLTYAMYIDVCDRIELH